MASRQLTQNTRLIWWGGRATVFPLSDESGRTNAGMFAAPALGHSLRLYDSPAGVPRPKTNPSNG